MIFTPHFIKNYGRGEELLTITYINTVVWVSKGMLPVKYFITNKSFFVVNQISLRSQDCHKDDVNPATRSLRDITVVSV